MVGLLLKDFINLKRYLKIFGFYALIYGFLAFTQKDASYFTSIFTILFSILTLSSYSYDEMAKWDIYALTMPVTREDIVRSKYSLMLLLSVLGCAFSILFTIVLNKLLGVENGVLELEACFIVVAAIAFFYAIVIPIITKLGVEKARFIFFAVYMIPFGIAFIIKQAAEAGKIQIPTRIVELIHLAMQYRRILIPVILVVALWISYQITIQIYRKKEF